MTRSQKAGSILGDYEAGTIDKEKARQLLGELTDDRLLIEEMLAISDGESDVGVS